MTKYIYGQSAVSRNRHNHILVFVIVLVVIAVLGGYKLVYSHKSLSTEADDPTSVASPQLDQLINTWAKSQTFSSSVSVRELTGPKRSANYSATTQIVPASTYKLYVAYGVLHAVEQGKYQLNNVISDGNTIQTDLTNMIVSSDDTAGRALGFLIGWKNINGLLANNGITSTNLYNYDAGGTTVVSDKHTTASDLARFLTKLNNDNLLNHNGTQILLDFMKAQIYRQGIPASIPSSVAVADMPGWLTVAGGDGENVENDAAIIYGPKSTYVLAIATKGTQQAPIAGLSKQIYDFLQN
ncbi:MAG: serine hydrolase [Candidatus Saccharimonadales bacterium]